MTESCRLITTEQYKEWKDSEKKLAIAIEALKEIEKNGTRNDIQTITNLCVQNWLQAHKALKEMEEV